MPDLERYPESFTDMVFPANGIDLSGAYSEQSASTTRLGANVRAFEAMAMRNRGGSRPGIAKYLDDVFATVTRTTVILSGSGYAIPSQASPGGQGIQFAGSNGTTANVGPTTYLSTYGIVSGYVFDARGAIYVTFDAGDGTANVVALNGAPAILAQGTPAGPVAGPALTTNWAMALNESFGNSSGATVAMCIGDNWVFVIGLRFSTTPPQGWVSSYAPQTIVTCLAYDRVTGAVKGNKPLFLINGQSTTVTDSSPCRWSSFCQGILCVGLKAGRGLYFYNTQTDPLQNAPQGEASVLPFTAGPADGCDVIDIATNSLDRFFVLTRNTVTNATAFLYVYDLNGVQLQAVGLDNPAVTSMSYDGSNNRLCLGYFDSSPGYDLEFRDTTTLGAGTRGLTQDGFGTDPLPYHADGVSPDGALGIFFLSKGFNARMYPYRATQINPYIGDEYFGFGGSFTPRIPHYPAGFLGLTETTVTRTPLPGMRKIQLLDTIVDPSADPLPGVSSNQTSGVLDPSSNPIGSNPADPSDFTVRNRGRLVRQGGSGEGINRNRPSSSVLVVTAKNVAKTYGAGFTFRGTEFTAIGLVPGDSITHVDLVSSGADSAAAQGTYPIIAANASGFPASHYRSIQYKTGTMTVSQFAYALALFDYQPNQAFPAGTQAYSDSVVFAGAALPAITITANPGSPVSPGYQPAQGIVACTDPSVPLATYIWPANGAVLFSNSTLINATALSGSLVLDPGTMPLVLTYVAQQANVPTYPYAVFYKLQFVAGAWTIISAQARGAGDYVRSNPVPNGFGTATTNFVLS